jgi:hypothetical protein
VRGAEKPWPERSCRDQELRPTSTRRYDFPNIVSVLGLQDEGDPDVGDERSVVKQAFSYDRIRRLGPLMDIQQ